MKHFAGHAFLKQWVTISSLLLGITANAQDIAVGTWRTHFNYSDARIVTASSDKIFCASENGLFSWDIAQETARKLSKLDGLSDVGVSAMDYSSNENVLVIGYRSGFIDFVFEDQIVSVSDIANSNLEGDKSINDIGFGGGRTYASTDLGIVVFESSTGNILENFVQIGSGGEPAQVQEIQYDNNTLYIITEEGIQSGDLGVNLLDFNNWTRYPGTSTFFDLKVSMHGIYALQGTNLMEFADGAWTDTTVDLPGDATRLFLGHQDLLTATSDGSLYEWDGASFVFRTSVNASSINDITYSNTGEIYIADVNLGLQYEGSTDSFSPAGPYSDDYSNIKAVQGSLYAFHAPSVLSYDGSEKVNEYSLFADATWTLETIGDFQNISDVAVFNSNRYFSSIGSGLYDETNDEILKDLSNSVGLDTILTALDVGDDLWVVGFSNIESAHRLDSDGSWTSYSSSTLASSEIVSIDLSQTGLAWMLSSFGSITVLDPDQNDVEFLSGADGIPSSVTDVEISIEDDAWIGTLRGPATFSDASFIFNDQTAITPTFENRILFEGEVINTIMTDGGNRVWFGTNKGLWVFDENTSEQVAVFNESNSPIPSNRILQLAYNGRNGEVFIVTDKGMVSYRSASSIGNRDHRNVSIFPNPVRPDYQGVVGIKGLARNTSLKITDINGNLVREVQANGGSASWDLLDLRGGRVVTGVYFFFSSTSDGEETYVGKIAVVR